MKLMHNKKRKIAYLPTTTAGHPLVLSDSVSKLGYKVRVWKLENDIYGYRDNQAIFNSKNRFLSRELKRFQALLQVAWWADVVHCTFGSSLAGNSNITARVNSGFIKRLKFKLLTIYEITFFNLEMKIYKYLNKKLIVDYQGDDIRQNYEHSIAHVVDDFYYTTNSDSNKNKKLSKFINYGFTIYALNPDLLHYLPSSARFIPYSNVALNSEKSAKDLPSKKPLVFVHAPSNRRVKGSENIIQVFSELKEEGYEVELKVVEGRKNSEALEVYSQSFMAIDQLNAGWYGGFAVECMAQGVPVISYIRDSDLKFLPIGMKDQMPIINACACTLRSQILQLINISKDDYKKLSQSSLDYVKAWHDPDVIAQEVAKNYL